jgi:hypothetical protein
MSDPEVLAQLEILADHFGIQVLVTGDLDTIDTDVAPWLYNIVVDGRGHFLLPITISENENDSPEARLWENDVMGYQEEGGRCK